MTEWNKYNQPTNPPDPVGNKEEPEVVDEETDLDEDVKTIVEKLEEIRLETVQGNEILDSICDKLRQVLNYSSDIMEEIKAFRLQVAATPKKVKDSQWEDVEEDFKPRKPRKPVSGLGEPSKKPKPKKKGKH